MHTFSLTDTFNKDAVGLLIHFLSRLFIRTDSEIFEDAVELQQFFIKIRDELCKNGEILLSSSLNYTLKHLNSDVEQEKREKIPKEIEEDKQKTEEEKGGKCEVFFFPTMCRTGSGVCDVKFISLFCCLKMARKPKACRKTWRRSETTSRTAATKTTRTTSGSSSTWSRRSPT